MNPSEISTSEYNTFYQVYINLIEEIALIEALEKGLSATKLFFESIPENKWDYKYAIGKWTPKDILLHITDTERVFAYRALYFSRFINADLKGFDENIFAANADADNQTVRALLQNYESVRSATLTLFKSFNKNQMKQLGKANGSEMSVRAAGFIICGHEIHHCNIIRERYLK